MKHYRYTGPSDTLDLPWLASDSLGEGLKNGQVVNVTDDQAEALDGRDDFELLDEVVLAGTGKLRITEYRPHVEDTVTVTRTKAGQVAFEDGSVVTWPVDGGTAELTPDQADQLRQYDHEFDVPAAPDVPVTVPIDEAPALPGGNDSRDAWEAYAVSLGLDVPVDMGRNAIRDLVASASAGTTVAAPSDTTAADDADTSAAAPVAADGSPVDAEPTATD